ncbi:MAG: hypothetical protein HRU09_21075 [Oligoflexales bacterium]|nr:hypothetical protein [Oligoflexales bacterium]
MNKKTMGLAASLLFFSAHSSHASSLRALGQSAYHFCRLSILSGAGVGAGAGFYSGAKQLHSSYSPEQGMKAQDYLQVAAQTAVGGVFGGIYTAAFPLILPYRTYGFIEEFNRAMNGDKPLSEED